MAVISSKEGIALVKKHLSRGNLEGYSVVFQDVDGSNFVVAMSFVYKGTDNAVGMIRTFSEHDCADFLKFVQDNLGEPLDDGELAISMVEAYSNH